MTTLVKNPKDKARIGTPDVKPCMELKPRKIHGDYFVVIDGEQIGTLDVSSYAGRRYVSLMLVDYSLRLEEIELFMEMIKKRFNLCDNQRIMIQTI